MPPLAWMLSAVHGAAWPQPSRVLCCGALAEAPAIAKALPEGEVVVLEPSDDQAGSLRKALSRRRLRNVHVEAGTIADDALPGLTGGNFDLVLAPGVFRGIEDVGQAMTNLAACLADNGALYLELDAAHHPASRASAILAQFPVEPADATPDRIAILASGICGVRPLPSSLAPGVPPRCWPLEKWIDLAAGAGLLPAACSLPQKLLPLGLPFGGISLLTRIDLIPLCRLLEAIAAPPVLQVVLSLKPLDPPPWSAPALLADWCPFVQFWPRNKIPPLESPFTNGVELGIDIPGILEPQKLQITAFLLEFLRRCDGQTPIRDILDSIDHPAKVEDVINALFFFHHTCILRLLPPAQ